MACSFSKNLNLIEVISSAVACQDSLKTKTMQKWLLKVEFFFMGEIFHSSFKSNKGFYLQSNSVIANTRGPSKNIRYNRDSL